MINVDQCFWIGDNYFGVFQVYYVDKQVDIVGDIYMQVKWNIGDYLVMYVEDGQQQQVYGVLEDGVYVYLLWQFYCLYYYKGEKGVQVYCWCQGDWQVCEQIYQDIVESGNQIGGYKYGVGIYVCYVKNLWVNKNDIYYCQECGEIGDGFGVYCGVVFVQFKYVFQQILVRRLVGLLLIYYWFLNVRRENLRLFYIKLWYQVWLYGNFFYLFCLYGNDCVVVLSIMKMLNLLIWKGYDLIRSSIF